MAFTREQFARTVLSRIGAKPTNGAMQAMLGWMQAEGGHWHNSARFNPLNTTEQAKGAGNTGSQGNIKVYRSPAQGVRATVRTLENGNYGGIIAALKRGDPSQVAHAIDASPWGTHGALVYSTISAAPKGAGGGSTVIRSGRPARAATDAPGGSSGAPVGSASSVAESALLARLQTPRQAPQSSGLQAPAFSAGIRTPAGYRPSLPSSAPPARTDSVGALLRAAAQAATTSASVPTASGGGHRGHAKPTDVASLGNAPPPRELRHLKGTTTFEGHTVAAWIAPVLKYARTHGWQGGVNSGYRSYGEQKAIYDSGVRPAAVPGTSNHEGSQFPRGAVDVTDAQQLSSILLKSRYRHLLQYAGAKDNVHFSHPHNGGY